MSNVSFANHGGFRRSCLAAAITSGAILLSGCNDEMPAAAVPQPVQVMTVARTNGDALWSLVGTIRSRYETDLGFRVAGKITERLVDVGQVVAAGQPIARLDSTDLRLSVESAEAELRAATSNREQAVAAEGRYKILQRDGTVAQAAFDQKVAAADETRARFDRAVRTLELARNQLAYSELKSDAAGVVSAMPVEVGQVVAVGQPVARIARLDAREAVVAVPEQMIDQLKTSSAELELWGDSNPRLPVRLRELAPQADVASRTFQARFSIEAGNAPGIVLGRTATVRLKRSGVASSIDVPLSAVLNDGNGAAVYVVDHSGQRVTRRPVTIASFSQDRVRISSGVDAGERIVTLGVHMLDDAKLVRIVEQRAEAR